LTLADIESYIGDRVSQWGSSDQVGIGKLCKLQENPVSCHIWTSLPKGIFGNGEYLLFSLVSFS